MILFRRVMGVAMMAAGLCASGCDTKPTLRTACSLSPSSTAFGSIVLGAFKDVTIVLTNQGDTHLIGVLTLSPQGGGFGVVGSNAYDLEAGESGNFTVRFQPTSPGVFTCTIATSPAACQTTCTGTGLAASVTWTNLTPAGTSPSPRASHSAIYDPVRDRMVVFGGNDDTRGVPHLLNDVWALSLTGSPAWTQLTPAGTPPSPRSTHTAIYDAGLDHMVVFGGFDGTNRLNDVWTLSLAGSPIWTHVTLAGTLPGRGLHTAIYDPTPGRMVVFGGLGQSLNYRNDVWALSLTGSPAWTEITPAGPSPSVRASHAAIFDPVGDRMIVSGGYGNFLDKDDVWALSLAGSPTWMLLGPAGTPPSARQGHSAIYDVAADRMQQFGGYNNGSRTFYGDVWHLALAGSPAWTTPTPGGTPPSARRSHTAVYDPLRSRMVVFGGQDLFGFTGGVWALE